jgi:hypothetical protein
MNLLPRPKHKPDLDAIERELSLPARAAEDYAPKKRPPKEELPELAMKVIRTFGALPTTELDEMIHLMEVEVAQIKRDAEQIKSDYFALTSDMVANIKRLTSGCALAKETLGTLRTQVLNLNGEATPRDEPKGPVLEPSVDHDETELHKAAAAGG